MTLSLSLEAPLSLLLGFNELSLIPINRADYWKSQGRKFCDFCKCWIADNKPSIEFHEGGKKHKENVSRRLREIHKNSAKQAKQNKKFEDDLKKMENAAMAAYLKDVENNTRDMTAEKIIKEKLTKSKEPEPVENVNRPPPAAPETHPRFKGKNHRNFSQEIDPCDPAPQPRPMPQPRVSTFSGGVGGENKAQGKSKPGKGKGKGKKIQENNRANKPETRKLWYEALSPEGYTYYWHVETNESMWDPPAEGFMTFAEQEEEAKEQAIQEELLEQLEQEEAVEKADIIEEQRANAEREKLKELRKKRAQKKEDGEHEVEVEDDEKPTYRRDYSVPEKPDPYGAWKTVQVIERKPVDLQLPKPTVAPISVPTLHSEPVMPTRSFKEKTISHISTGNSDDDGAPTMFKKRKIGNKNVRRRMDDD